MKLQIQSLHFNADEKLLEFINKKVEKLNTYHDQIINSEIILSLDKLSTTIRDKVVVIKTHVPGATLIAKESSKIFEESVDVATDSIRRQLRRHKERLGEKVKK